jgi:hypothetical protein
MTYLVVFLVAFSALILLLLIARFVQPELIYSLRQALGRIGVAKANLDRRAHRVPKQKDFRILLMNDLRYETRDKDEESIIKRVDKIRQLYHAQMRKPEYPGLEGKPQVCIVELAGLLANMGRDVTLEAKFRYSTIDANSLLAFIGSKIREHNGEPPFQNTAQAEGWFTEHPISIEQVVEILIAAVYGLAYRQRVQFKSHEEERVKRAEGGGEGIQRAL